MRAIFISYRREDSEGHAGWLFEDQCDRFGKGSATPAPGGEIIRFDVGDKSFVWNFNGQRSSFDLSRVAPRSVLDRKVTAYVAPNPMYPRRS